MKTEFFFVYGTLKKDGRFAKDFDKYRINSEKATISNMNLYKINWFPGMLPGNGTVIGELHEYKDPKTVVALMNRIEGCDGSKQGLFKREHRIVVTESGKKVKAIMYLFNHKVKQFGDAYNIKTQPIKSGIWINKNLNELLTTRV